MPKYAPIVPLICLACLFRAAAYAQQMRPADPSEPPPTLQIGIQTGYHTEGLRWSIAGNLQGESPNIYSELIWKHVNGLLCATDVRWKVWRSLEVYAHFSMASISGGKVTDTDYHGDNRTGVAYYGYFDAGRGNVLSGELRVGYRLSLGAGITLTPAIGYGADRQLLYILPYAGNAPSTLNSSYDALWKGFTGSLSAVFPLNRRWEADPSISYHQVALTGTADWNLIDNFQHPVSFRDHANGFGVVPDLAIVYRLHSHWSVFVHGSYGYWRTGAGVDELYMSSGTTSLTQYNGCHRSGGDAGLGFRLSL